MAGKISGRTKGPLQGMTAFLPVLSFFQLCNLVRHISDLHAFSIAPFRQRNANTCKDI